MREKYRSETKRKGEPDSHHNAVVNIIWFLSSYWDKIFKEYPRIDAPYHVVFPEPWRHENNLDYAIHQYDIGVLVGNKLLMIIEVGGVGDDSKHQLPHKKQLINDGIAKRYIEEFYPSCLFYRINKEDAMIEDHLFELFTKNPEVYCPFCNQFKTFVYSKADLDMWAANRLLFPSCPKCQATLTTKEPDNRLG